MVDDQRPALQKAYTTLRALDKTLCQLAADNNHYYLYTPAYKAEQAAAELKNAFPWLLVEQEEER